MRVLQYAAMVLLGAAAVAASATGASAQQLTNNMTCSQAQKMYQAQGRIQTRTRSGAVVVLNGGVPATQRSKLTCIRSTRMATMVITTDNNRCAISYRCR